jgi:hypothetical protein
MTTGINAFAPFQRPSRTMIGEHEDVEDYRPGGLHPIDIGDDCSLDGQEYTIVRKLGHGSVSTVWLAALHGENKLQIRYNCSW